MGKTRMGVLDLQVQARDIRRGLIGSRVANVYDVNSRTYVLKLNVPPRRNWDSNAHQPPTLLSSGVQKDGADNPAQSTPAVESRPAPTVHATAGTAQPPCPATPASTPASESGWRKVLLLIESGARIHTTQFDRDHGAVPSGFCLKLRKHIRTRRLAEVRQLGGDRVIVLTFAGGGEVVAHLIVEFYAGGNVILTNAEFFVLDLLRVVRPRDPAPASTARGTRDDDGNAAADVLTSRHTRPLAVKDRYPVEDAHSVARMTVERVRAGLNSAARAAPSAERQGTCQTRAERRRAKAALEARKALASALEVGPQVVEHALCQAGYPVNISITEVGTGADSLAKLCSGFEEVERMLEGHRGESAEGDVFITDGMQHGVEVPRAAKGYVFVKPAGHSASPGDADAYEDFSPFLLAQYADRPSKEYATFDEAVDEYFTHVEMAREKAAKCKREAAAFKKVDKLTAELNGRVSALEKAQQLSRQKAQAIEGNIAEVDAAIKVICSAIAAEVDWEALGRMVEEEKKNGNPVAEIIHSLNLKKNMVTLMLEDTWGLDDETEEDAEGVYKVEGENEQDDVEEFDEYEDADFARPFGRRLEKTAATRKALLVDINLSLSAHANARVYYANKKIAAVKKEKARQATERTIKAASKRAVNDAKRMEIDAVASSIRARRKPLWFEKFHWMVSSENFLIVASRDAQQSELLVKRYMGPGDAYVHAGVQGAASVIVKNYKPPGQVRYRVIPRLTLEQAGSVAMCRSSAWDGRVVTSAWWVHPGQVSKNAPKGLSLATGSFVIRGKKNFLNPSQLVMGFTFLFKVHESCVANHRGERTIRGADDSLLVVPPLEGGGDSTTSGLFVTEGTAEGTWQEHSEDGTMDIVPERNAVDGVPASVSAKGDRFDDSDEEEASGGKATEKEADAIVSTPGVLDGSEIVSNPAEGSAPDDAQLFSRFAERARISSVSKYGLDHGSPEVTGEESDSVQDELEKKPVRSAKKHLSARERRLQKKGLLGSGAADSFAELSSAGVPGSEKDSTLGKKGKSGSGSGGGSSKPAAIPRGKKSKLKKMKQKYGDQDETEREIALAVLGAKKVRDTVGSCARTEGKSDFEPRDTEQRVEQTDGREQPSRANDIEGAVAEEKLNSSPPSQLNGLESTEANGNFRMTIEGGIEDLNALEEETHAILEMLTANPLPDDVVEYALPVCAPYSILSDYRYRVKLLPGAMKRGKAFRATQALFLKQAGKDLNAHRHERNAIQLTPDSDSIQVMLPNVRVMAPGLAEAQKAARRGNK